MAGSGKVVIGRDQWLALLVLAVVAMVVGVVAVVSAGSSSSGDAPRFTDSPLPNVDRSNSRQASGPINGGTVSRLSSVWTVAITAKGGSYGGYLATPVVEGAVAYSQDEDSNVQAIALENGEILWRKSFDHPVSRQNGLVVAGKRVFGATETAAFALDRITGDEVWSTQLAHGSRELIEMAPGYHDGLVYLATTPAKFRGGRSGNSLGP